MIRDEVAVHNERMKLFAGYLNALAIGLAGVGVLAPLVGLAEARDAAPGSWPFWLGWMGLSLAFHAMGHYVLGRLKKALPP